MGSAIDGARHAGSHPRLEHAMIERINTAAPQSGAEALKALRSAFPESPLALRVAALVSLARRQNGESTSR